jgi:hypothetical protein
MSRGCLALDATGTRIAIPLRVARGADAVLVRCQIAILTIRGTWPENQRLGLSQPEWALADAVEVEGITRVQLERVVGVVAVDRVEATHTAAGWSVVAEVRVQGDEEIQRARLGMGDASRSSPAAWYMLLPLLEHAPILGAS